jgi:HSP20 family protein
MKGNSMSTIANTETRAAGYFVTPGTNVFETKDGYVLEAELPGVSKDGLEVTVDGNELTLVGRRGSDTVKAESLYRESSAADYRRVFELDPSIEASKIEAKIDQGVLTLQLPKSERGKPRTIAVNS